MAPQPPKSTKNNNLFEIKPHPLYRDNITGLTIMIDNYDSFTYNIVQYLSELGANVQTIRNDDMTLQQIIDLNPSRIVISPGPGLLIQYDII